MKGGQPTVDNVEVSPVRQNTGNVCVDATDQNLLTVELKASGSSKIVEFVDVLSSIDTDSPLASLNRTSIADNNGGRIEL